MTLLAVLSAIGATLIVVRGTVFQRLRKLYPPLLECSQCTGFWVGVAVGGAGLVSVGRGRIVDALVAGCATSFLSLVADAMLLKLLGDPHEKDSS